MMKIRHYVILLLAAAGALGCYVCVGVRAQQVRSADPDLLPVVLQGCKMAAASVRSGSGRVVVHDRLVKRGGGLLEVESVCNVAFRGNSFRLTRRTHYIRNEPGEGTDVHQALVEPGTTTTEQVAFDGAEIRWLGDERTARVGNSATRTGRHELGWYAANLGVGVQSGGGNGVCDLQGFFNGLASGGASIDPPEVVGREVVEGDDCVILQWILHYTGASGEERLAIDQFWVDPVKGYTIRREKHWESRAGSPEKILTGEASVSVREYGEGVWGPDTVESKQYRVPSTGEAPSARHELVITFDPGFALNGSVRDADLSLAFPSGTRVSDEVTDAEYTVP